MNKNEQEVYDAFLDVLKKSHYNIHDFDTISVYTKGLLSFCQALATKHQMGVRDEELKLQKRSIETERERL